jgi:hypothetical protein
MHVLETATLRTEAAPDVTPNRRLARIDKGIDGAAPAAEPSGRRELHERGPERNHRLRLCRAISVVDQVAAQPIDERLVPEILQAIVEALRYLRVAAEPLLDAF